MTAEARGKRQTKRKNPSAPCFRMLEIKAKQKHNNRPLIGIGGVMGKKFLLESGERYLKGETEVKVESGEFFFIIQ